MEMLDAIKPKTDQLNADDLLGGRTLTITVTEVRIKAGDQPVSIHFQGDNGKPYKPAKSMSRVLVLIWGADAKNYIGRSMTLYCDPNVTFGKDKVGGIRISHMSHIDEAITVSLTATKASRKPFTVKPMKNAPGAPPAEKQKTASETPFPIYDGKGALLRYAENPDQWKAWFGTNVPKLTLEQIEALQKSNMVTYTAVNDAGFPDLVGDVKGFFTDRKQQLSEVQE